MEEKTKSDKCEEKQESGDTETPSTSNEVPQSKTKNKTYWHFLEHAGPAFPAPYERLPEHVHFEYKGKVVKLSKEAEEAAGFYAMKLDSYKCADNEKFKSNFFEDWCKLMKEERQTIQSLSECNFENIKVYLKNKHTNKDALERKIKEDKIIKEKHGYCNVDGKNVKIGNYKVEQPDIFCPTGYNVLMGKLKQRIEPKHVTINCSKDSKLPELPPGQHWGDVLHSPNKSYLAFWVEKLQNKRKYMRLDRSSDHQQEVDRDKYETARELHKHIGTIRDKYREDWLADDLESRERGVALYFLDTLAFRAGSEEEANTTGCCTLKVKHVGLCGNNVVHFDFYGKTGVKYKKNVTVEEPVYNNLKLFYKTSKIKNGDESLEPNSNLESLMESLKLEKGDDLHLDQAETPKLFNKTPSTKDADELLFDQLNLKKLNDYLKDLNLMPNLTAKVFRTYRACVVFEENLKKLTREGDTIKKKIVAFKEANLEVAKLCNHKYKERASLSPDKSNYNENKEYNLFSSKEEYIDPRIVVTWCKKHNVPIEDVYSGKLCAKYTWADDEIEDDYPDYVFADE